MYVWRINRLTAALQAAPVPTRDRWGYGLLSAAVWCFGWFTSSPAGPMAPSTLLLEGGLALMGAAAIWWAARINGGTDTFGRLLALWFVLGNRMMVAALALALVATVVFAIVGWVPSPTAVEPTVWILGYTWQAIFLWRLLHHVRVVAATET